MDGNRRHPSVTQTILIVKSLAPLTLVRSAAGISMLSSEYPHILSRISLRIAPSFAGLRRECGPQFIPGCEHNAVRDPLSIVITASIWAAGGFLPGAMDITTGGFKNAAKG